MANADRVLVIDDDNTVCELVSALAKISGRRIVMIFDAWEKAGDAVREQDFLDTYLKHREDWPE